MRNWKPYSSVARDGEKTVYCSKGNHSVYYGNAFISFKPSKLIWCEECMNTYYTPQPTLFTEEVNPMKCNKNPLNNLVEMPETPTAEELILWLTSNSHSHYAKGGDRLLKSISNQAKEKGSISPKQEAIVLSFYSQAAAHNNSLTNKVWGHEWQKDICKWCGANKKSQPLTEEVITMKPTSINYIWTYDNVSPFDGTDLLAKFNEGVRYGVITQLDEIKPLLADGTWGNALPLPDFIREELRYQLQDLGIPVEAVMPTLTQKVEQTGFTMTEKQIAYIRDLFKAKKQFMTIDEQESLINKMTGHINGSAVLTTKWASAAITKLKSYNTERSAS